MVAPRWLLVEISARAAAPIKSIAADRPKMAVLGGLHLYQPAQRLQAAFKHRGLAGRASAQNQRVRELGVVVSQLPFKPGPVRLGRFIEQLHEPRVSVSRV